MSEPDFCYDPDEWEYTCEWNDRDSLAEDSEIQSDEVRRYRTLVRGPDKFCVVIENKFHWFDNEADARHAIGLPAGDLFK